MSREIPDKSAARRSFPGRTRERPGGGAGRVARRPDPLRLGVVCLALALGTAAARAEAQEPADSRGGDGPNGDAAAPVVGSALGARDSLLFEGEARALDVRVPRLEEPGIKIDGVLDDAAWREAAVLGGFTLFEPVEDLPTDEPTEVLVLYAPDAIYFGIIAFDSRPDLIPAILAQRDRGIFGDDYIRLMIDTFYDQRQAYLFYVNPRGLQADGLWIEGQRSEGGRPPVDLNPDFVWESAGRVTEEGWVAEIRIPYENLQFPEQDEHVWGFNAVREVRRTGYKQSWAPLTQEQTSTLAQSGRLGGLRQLTPRRLIEINPVATGKVDAQYDGEQLVRGSLEPDVGLDARYGLTRNLTLGATVNPDFSQVEADVDQITVNERFAVFFPEKRPFFLDGTEVFSTPSRLVHTRQIVNPSGGAKVTGKVGALNVGYLGALDRSPIDLDEADSEALFNLARLRMDVGAGSTIGGLYTDRTLLGGEGYNRVAAADARILFGERHSLTAQVAGAWTRETIDDVDESRFGPLVAATLARSGREFSWQLSVEDVHPDFETETGFIRRVGDLRTAGSVERTFFLAPGSTLESYGFELRLDGFFDHDEFWSGSDRRPFEFEAEVQADLSFRGSRSLNAIFRDGYFRFSEANYLDYQVEGPEGELAPYATPEPLTHLLAGGFFSWWRFSNALQLRGRLFLRETPIFAEGSRGRELSFGPSLEIRPTPALRFDLSYDLSRIWRVEDGSFFSAADIPRLRVQYQFNRALFTRVILQYDLEKRDALRDPRTGGQIWIGGEPAEARQGGNFLGQLLVAYEPAPRTTFFIGWSRQMEGERGFSLGRMETITEGFFAKLSYLFRL